MKFIFYGMLAVTFVACSNAKQTERSSTDSLHVSTADNHDFEETSAGEIVEGDSLANEIAKAVQELQTKFEIESNRTYTLTSNFAGYESSSTFTWYFDSLMNLRYYKGDWSMEGTSGSDTHYFEDDNLLASLSDEESGGIESTVIFTGLKPIYGFTKTTGDDGEDRYTYIDETKYNARNSSVMQSLTEIVEFVRNNIDSATVTENEISIHLENTVHYGEDFVETQDCLIGKALYDKLVKRP